MIVEDITRVIASFREGAIVEGKENMELHDKDLEVEHLSHPHPLKLTASPSNIQTRCAGCMSSIIPGQDCFNCSECSFFLHSTCYNLPKTKIHPAHSRHLLSLVTWQSTKDGKTALRCAACVQHVTAGFYYHCDECNISYHILCLALPHSIEIPTHLHKIKLQFSPPYDFYCNICDKAGYKGWLYRCSMCEFDTHIDCAIKALRPHEGNSTVTADFNSLCYELMNSAAQVSSHGAIAGWDMRLNSPKQKYNKTDNPLYQTAAVKLTIKPDSSCTAGVSFSPGREGKSHQLDPMRSPLSEDYKIATPSSQFSDVCFSIDFARSYSNYNPTIHEQAGESETDKDTEGVVLVQAGKCTDKIGGSGRQDSKRISVATWGTADSFNMGLENRRSHEAFIPGGSKNSVEGLGEIDKKRKAKENPPKSSSMKDQTRNTTGTAESCNNSSSWKSFFGCCFEQKQTYQRY